MNITAIQNLVGFIILSSILLDVWLTNGHNCTKKIENNEKIFDCSYKNLIINVPQDLDTDLTELDLSGNTMKLILEKSFTKYYQLKVLRMRSMLRLSGFGYEPWTFKGIYSIEVFDMSNFSSDLVTPEFTAWPPNVHTLHINDNQYLKLNLGPLKKLEKLYASNLTNMKQFPDINPLAPISVIDLKYTPIENLTTEILAGLCKLEHLNISGNAFPNESYCECLKFNRWMKTYEIVQDTPLNCVLQSSDELCNLQFDESLETKRRDCIIIYLNHHTFDNWYLVIPVVMVIVLSLLIPSYLYMNRYRTEHHKKHQHIFSRHKSHESFEEIATPTNDPEVEGELPSSPTPGEISPENVEQ